MVDRVKLEKVPQRQGASWRCLATWNCEGLCERHYHHEYELVLHRNTAGKGSIGHYEGVVEHNSLWLIAPNTPHAFNCQSDSKDKPAQRISVWFKREWLANMMFNCIELRKLEALLKRAQKGICLSKETAERVYRVVSKLDNITHIEQLASLITLLGIISEDKQATTLLSFARDSASDHKANKIHTAEKIEKLSHFIDSNYHKPITLGDLAKHLCTSESSIHRMFEAHFRESFSQYLKKFRLNHAAELLVQTKQPIQLIAENVGYHNQANFNRLFKQYKQMTPRQYRVQFG
ncbi:AraC family transcriptional regulator [Vibrio inusitatus NBRC 102082]|uniref:AraC family transcriptional regulator n=1 Tax=Vibrio inusitatus NBRC 102082 TaxID=1219070 RepID=A0A4Y3HZK6_9VIBR|nr:AraC family transcriptional regulator [Vibrio inusitatus NBRC 102082]